jgi:hypothetical protein
MNSKDMNAAGISGQAGSRKVAYDAVIRDDGAFRLKAE